MGSKSSSSTRSTNQTTDITTSTTDNRILDGDGFIEGNININAQQGQVQDLTIVRSDHGAIASATKVQMAAFQAINDNLDSALEFVESARDPETVALNKAVPWLIGGVIVLMILRAK